MLLLAAIAATRWWGVSWGPHHLVRESRATLGFRLLQRIDHATKRELHPDEIEELSCARREDDGGHAERLNAASGLARTQHCLSAAEA